MPIYHARWSDGRPPDRPAPAALLLHGWGGDETSMAVFESAFEPGWLLVRPRAPHPLPEGGYAWALPGPDGRPDPQTIIQSAAELIDLMETLSRREPIDPRRWWVVGFSQGGAMAAQLARFAPERIAGLAVFSGFLWELPEAPAPRPLAGLPAFVAHGLQDPLVPVEQARALCRWLKAAGAETTCVEYPGGHKTGVEAWRAFRTWLSQRAAPR